MAESGGVSGFLGADSESSAEGSSPESLQAIQVSDRVTPCGRIAIWSRRVPIAGDHHILTAPREIQSCLRLTPRAARCPWFRQFHQLTRFHLRRWTSTCPLRA
jgi:hypothetical protein